jgi:mannose-6-phosphate isomerase-like protein (cupin superfamily)
MRNAFLLSFIFAGALTLAAQTPSAPAQTKPATAAPAKQTPAPAPAKPAAAPAKPAAAPATTAAPAQAPTTGTGTTRTRATTGTRTTAPAAGRSGIALTVADMTGRMLSGVQVDVQGPTTRRDATNSGGQVNFAQLQAGTYRLTFSGDDVTTFEREVTLAAGKVATLDISLNPAPPPREIVKEVPAAVQAAPTQKVGPLGQAQLTSLYDMAETELKSRTPRREMLVACSGNLRTTMILLADKEESALPKRMYENAEVSYYVLGGEATMQVGSEQKNLAAGGYAAVPRGVPVTIARKGNKALSLLSLLSGEPCEQAK